MTHRGNPEENVVVLQSVWAAKKDFQKGSPHNMKNLCTQAGKPTVQTVGHNVDRF